MKKGNLPSGFRVLVIDDDDMLGELIDALLSAHKFQVSRAHDGKEGLRLARDFRPNAIILDRNMPEMDGNEVLKELKASSDTRSIPVIMLTAEKRRSEIEDSLKLGALDYIIKPFDYEEFVERVKKILFLRVKAKTRPKT